MCGGKGEEMVGARKKKRAGGGSEKAFFGSFVQQTRKDPAGVGDYRLK